MDCHGGYMVKQELLKDRDGVLTFKKFIDNLQIVPTPATITITDAAGDDMPTPIIDAVMSIDSYGTMTYTLVAANTVNLGENFKAVVKYTYGGIEYQEKFLFDIVISVLTSIIVDDDLINEYSKLKQLYYTTYGEVSSIGALSEIIDNKNLNETVDYYKGSKVKILSGNNKNLDIDIIAFNEGTGKLTLSKNAPNSMSVGDKFSIQKSYETEIQRAFEEIMDWLRTRGYRPALIIDDTDIRELHITCSIMKILHVEGKSERSEFEDYRKKYYIQCEELKLLYDTNESGEPEDADATRPQITFRR